MFDNEKKILEELDRMTREHSTLRSEYKHLEQTHSKLYNDMKFLIDNNEQEVSLRLQFEAKLNSLHALHRDLAAKYDRSTEEIYELENS